MQNSTKSGSGKIVFMHYDELAEIWGGSPSTEAFLFGLNSDSVQTSVSDNTDGATTSVESEDSIQSTESEKQEENGSSDNNKQRKKSNENGKRKVSPSEVPKLIDNKRKHLEKKLTSPQRDQKILDAAKDDIAMRKEMMECFKESSRCTAVAIPNRKVEE